MAEDIDRFIAEQKSKLARERQELQYNEQPQTNGTANGYHKPGLKENIPPDSKPLPSGSYENLREKLNQQRQEEYKNFLQEKNQRSSERKKPAEEDGATLLIPDRASAQNRARLERNREYNEFLKQQAHGKGRRVPGKQDGPVPSNKISNTAAGPDNPPARSGARTPSNRREFATQTPAPNNYDDGPPSGPRKGWGTPQPVDYDDLLRRKRQEESRYRRYDDDYDYHPSRRDGLRASHSDPYLNRYPPEDGRYSRRPDPYEPEYDRRRVRFSNDEGSPRKELYDRSYSRQERGGRSYYDDPYEWGLSPTGRSRTQPELERVKPALRQSAEPVEAKPPRAKSATAAEDGLVIGNRETASAARRKKEQYRLELEQQMKETKEAKQRERQQDLKNVARPAQNERGSSRTPAPSRQQQPQVNGYQPSFLNSTYNYNAHPPGPVGVQQGVPSRMVGNSSQPQVPELGLADAIAKAELGGLGLEAALAKSQTSMIDRPFSIAPPATNRINQPNPGDPYAYYGIRHPLEPDPTTGSYLPPSNGYPNTYQQIRPSPNMAQIPPNMAQNSPNMAYSSPLLMANDAVGVPPIAVGGSGYPASNPAAQQQRQQQQPPGGYSSDLVSPRAAKDTRSYQAQLLEQMREKELKKQKEKEERERYDAKLEAEAANYNPWGKGGAGAPMRDQTGNIVADLKQLHNRNEQIQQSPRDPKLQLFSDAGGLNPPPTNPAAGGGLSPRVEAPPAFAATSETSKFARGRGNLEPENRQQQGNTSDYKEMLRQQVEEKKRREAEEKEKQRLEEEKEEKRLAAQRERMKKEFEEEQERQRIKKEEKEKQQQELERQLREKQEAAEQRRKQQDEARQKREQEEDDKRRQEQGEKLNRAAVASPPIPTHQPNQRSDSPPLPALRKNEERGSSPPIPTLRKDKPPQEYPSERPKSRAIKPAGDFDLVTWLRDIDPALIQYAPALEENGYGSLRAMTRLNKQSLVEMCPDIKHGHVELILHDAGRIKTPRSKQAEEERQAKTPEIPQAAGSRDPRDVVRALSAMRNQLAVEQRRIQNQLDKHYDPHNQPNAIGAKKGTRSPQVDVFELARNKQKATVHREPLNRPAAHEFNSLKNRGTQSRQRLRDQYPSDPNSDISLEAQQRALLRNQQQRLEDMRKAQASEKDKYSSMPGMRPNDFKSHDAPSLQLDSESAFIGINSGETKMPDDISVPKPFISSDVPGNSKPPPDPLGSLASFDSTTLDFLAHKNKERNKALRALEPDRDSLAEADDILERFMVRGSHDRPNSRASEDFSLWMRPSDDL